MSNIKLIGCIECVARNLLTLTPRPLSKNCVHREKVWSWKKLQMLVQSLIIICLDNLSDTPTEY